MSCAVAFGWGGKGGGRFWGVALWGSERAGVDRRAWRVRRRLERKQEGRKDGRRRALARSRTHSPRPRETDSEFTWSWDLGARFNSAVECRVPWLWVGREREAEDFGGALW